MSDFNDIWDSDIEYMEYMDNFIPGPEDFYWNDNVGHEDAFEPDSRDIIQE